MDPLSILSAVLSTAIAILKWIQQREAKNESLRELSLTVSRICDILAPLQSPNARMPPNPKSRFAGNVVGSVSTGTVPHLDGTIVSCLQDMGETLSSVKEHLSLWKEKRSPAVLLLAFLSPSTVLDQLMADEQKLSRRLVVLSFALQVSTFHSSRGAIPSADPSPLDVIMNTEVRVFWHDRIGPQVSCAPAQSFCRAIGDWLNMLLDEITCDTLLLRLDEYAIGGITPSGLDRFVGNRSIREAIAYLGVVQVSPVDVAFESVDPSTVRPLLVWIDDYPENNTREVDYARDLGITVISIRSTAAAKVWIEANEALLRRTESVKRLRFISDNHRWESDQQASDYLNLSAGETMLRYLRGRLYTAPILIYCGASIVRTQYVLSYHRAGSTSDQNVCFSFIGALAQNVNNDNIWEQVDAHFISNSSPSLPRTIAENNLGSERIISPAVHLESRLSRFSDTNAIEEFCSIGPGGGTTRSFFSGKDVSHRMNDIREAITYIRTRWHDYNIFLQEVRLSFLTVDGDKNAASLFSSLPTRMEWADRRTAHPEQEEYRMLRLYTSLDGYKSIFAVLNEAFRSENLTGDRSRLHAAVFLIEVLTIELFNYMYRMSPTIGFSGTVYRGMRLRRDQLDQFYALTQRPVKERYWSIPLAFISTTTSLAISLKFAEPKGMPAPDSHAVLWRIRVADLEPALLAIYRERFPASVVTSLCAVRISDLSAFPEEEEILLRGPFFQLVYVATQPLGIPPGSAGVVHVVDGVMLNTNRDHPSTMEMGAEEGQRARALFACLVEIGRTKECLRLAEEYGLREDVEEYTQVWREAEQRLKILMGT